VLVGADGVVVEVAVGGGAQREVEAFGGQVAVEVF